MFVARTLYTSLSVIPQTRLISLPFTSSGYGTQRFVPSTADKHFYCPRYLRPLCSENMNLVSDLKTNVTNISQNTRVLYYFCYLVCTLLTRFPAKFGVTNATWKDERVVAAKVLQWVNVTINDSACIYNVTQYEFYRFSYSHHTKIFPSFPSRYWPVEIYSYVSYIFFNHRLSHRTSKHYTSWYRPCHNIVIIIIIIIMDNAHRLMFQYKAFQKMGPFPSSGTPWGIPTPLRPLERFCLHFSCHHTCYTSQRSHHLRIKIKWHVSPHAFYVT
jgi:hypothetical protein